MGRGTFSGKITLGFTHTTPKNYGHATKNDLGVLRALQRMPLNVFDALMPMNSGHHILFLLS